MTTTEIAAPRTRVRPGPMAVLLVSVFLIGLSVGLGVSRVTTVATVAPAVIRALPTTGDDMSSAAYAASHPGTLRALPTTGDDMSSAAYAAMHDQH